MRVPREAVAGALQQAGLTADLAGLYAEMCGAMDDGRLTYEENGARFVRGTTEPREVLRALVS